MMNPFGVACSFTPGMGVSPHYAETHETHETSGGSLTLKTSDLRHEPASSWRNERAMFQGGGFW